eukprot:5515555-Amphidinium_carterae.1
MNLGGCLMVYNDHSPYWTSGKGLERARKGRGVLEMAKDLKGGRFAFRPRRFMGGNGDGKKGSKLSHGNLGKGKNKPDQTNEASTEANATTEEQADILASNQRKGRKGKNKKPHKGEARTTSKTTATAKDGTTHTPIQVRRRQKRLV